MTNTDKPMRICVVSPLYHPSLGGLGRQALMLTERLSRKGVFVFVISRRMKNMPPAEFSQPVRVYRAWSVLPTLHNYEGISLRNILVSLTFSLSCCCLLVRHRKEYDIVHFHGASLPLFFNILPLKLLGKKLIAKVAAAKVSVEAGSLRGRYFGMGNAILRLLRKVDGFIAISSEIAEGLQNDGIAKARIHRITNFIDTARYSPATIEEKSRLKSALGLSNALLVTFSGRFEQRKGIIYLLEAWKIVSSNVPDTRLLLLGDGPLFGEMKDLAASLKVDKSIVMKGHVRNVIDYLRASDVYVFPSLQEGMPNALLEAMACGLPAVATRIGGVVDIVEDKKNGVLVEPKDVNGLATAMLQLINDRNHAARISVEAYQTIKNSYSLDGIIPKYLSLYNRL